MTPRHSLNDLPLAKLVDLFIASKQVEGRSTGTTDWYRQKLEHYCAFVDRDQAPTLADFSLANARSFVADLQSREMRHAANPYRPPAKGGLSAYTVHGYVRTLRAFSNWLHEEGYAAEPPLARLKPPKLPEVMIEVLSDDELGRLMAAIPRNTFIGVRLRAVFLLLLDTGIRASELCTLTLENTHLEEGYVVVTGKGNKERMVPFGTTTRKALLKYVHAYRPEAAHDHIDELILTRNGRPLGYSGLRLAMKRLGKKADVPRLHAHLVRHTFAVRYLMNGGDVMTLRLLLGHTTLAVTQMYMHLAQSHVQVRYSEFSPVDRLELGRRRLRKSR